MTPEEQHACALIAACAKEASAHILAYARDAGLDPPSFLVSVAAVLASAALAAQPDDQLQAASRHIQHALGLVHCLGEAEDGAATPHGEFAARGPCNDSALGTTGRPARIEANLP